MNLGTAFQLADDVLDFTADTEVLGKASGADLLEGKLTLPLILMVKRSPESRTELEAIMREGQYLPGVREKLLEMLKQTGTLEETRIRAQNYVDEAVKNIAKLPESEYRLALEDVPALMVNRKN